MTLVEAQQRYIDRVTDCHPGHAARVRRGARRQLHTWAVAHGYDGAVVCRDASDMARLQQASDD